MKRYLTILPFCFLFLSSSAKDYPASLFDIRSDGVTLNTRSIQFAIDYIHNQGGGRLVFDVGRFLTGSIHLKSGVGLHLLEGAVLVGSLNPLDYDRNGFTALVLSDGEKDISITGKGIIDGQGREVTRNVASLVHKGLIKDAFRNDRPEVEIRPMLIYFRNCETVLIKGVTMRNAAAWVQTYDQCKGLRIDSITVDSRAFWNNDGLDIVDCDSTSITNSYVDAADDGICLKSHDPNSVCQNIYIRKCTIRSSANAIKFGTASLGGFRNIQIRNIKVFDTYRSVLALEAVDGGFIEKVVADSLFAINTGHGIFIRTGERVPGRRSRIENINISHVQIEIAWKKADSGYEYEGPIEDMPRNVSPGIIIAGLPQNPVSNISFINIEIKHPGGGNPMIAKITPYELDSVPEKPAAYPEFSMFRELPAWGIYIRHAKDIMFRNLKLQAITKDYRKPIVLDDVHHAEFMPTTIKDQKPLFQRNSSGVVFNWEEPVKRTDH